MATTTSQNYTDQDIVDALRIAAQDDSVQIDIEEGERHIAGFEITDLRRFLDALPDQPADWEPVSQEDLRVGDQQVMVEAAHKTVIYKTPILFIDQSTGIVRFKSGDNYYIDDSHTLYRIPAPKPELPAATFSLIRNVTFETDEGPEKAPLLQRSKHDSWVGITADGIEWTSIGDDQITDWEPAKIVPKNFVGQYPTRKVEYKGLPNG